MCDWQADNAEFVELAEFKKRHSFQEQIKLCRTLIVEEVNEELLSCLYPKGEEFSLEEEVTIADGIIDSIYVLMQLANCVGLDLEPLWDEVHASNMSKFVPVFGGGMAALRRADGKILKPATFTPPDLKTLVEAQRNLRKMQPTQGSLFP
jgi:predicted HAD superfamily Cof-like phosphohydrolase